MNALTLKKDKVKKGSNLSSKKGKRKKSSNPKSSLGNHFSAENQVGTHSVGLDGFHFSRLPHPVNSFGFIQAKLTIGNPKDKYEREADAVADVVMRMPEEKILQKKELNWDGIKIQRKCKACEEEKLQLKSEKRTIAGNDAPSTVHDVLNSGGQSLNNEIRTFFESRFGYDFSQVRVHTNAKAVESARAMNANAFTIANNIVFGAGQFAPRTTMGMKLLAHELAHTVQQGQCNEKRHTIFREQSGETERRSDPSSSSPMLSVPGTELTLIPGPLSPFLLGARIPLPSSLRITNELGLGSGPTFVLDASPELLVANILQTVDLYTWTRTGTPPGAELKPENKARISLTNPRVTLDPRSGRLRGSARLFVGSDYPPSISAPTEIDVEIEATELGQFSGQLGLGPLHTDFTLRLNYDTGRLEEALCPVAVSEAGLSGLWNRFQIVLRDAIPGIKFDGLSNALQSLLSSIITGELQVTEFVTRTIDLIREGIPAGTDLDGLRTALLQFATEITHPGFTLSGSLGLDIPLLGTLPLTGFRAVAPTTVPLAQPLLGAPSAFPLSFTAGGVIIAPPGSISETAVPALGVTRSSFGEESGLSGTAALLPRLSTTAISAGEPIVNQFPVFTYAEISSVRRISENLELGLRLTVQVSTPELFGPAKRESGDLGEQLTRILQDYQESTQQGTSSTPVTPNVGLTLFGRFNAL